MRKKILTAGLFISALIMLGAGCSRAPESVAPFWREADGYGQSAATSIDRGLNGYSPAAPPASEDIFLPANSLPANQPAGASAGAPPSEKKVISLTPTAADYTKAVNDYRSRGAYFQFANCRGNPGTLTLKRGTGVMLDNRDAVAHKFIFGADSFRLAPYSFAIAKPKTAGLFYITCDGGGAAAVNVQP